MSLMLTCALFVVICNTVVMSAKCPCEKQSLCEPVTTKRSKETFLFSVHGDRWPLYDWTKITTIAQVGYQNSSLVCYAHSQNVKVVRLIVFPIKNLTVVSDRRRWVAAQVQMVRDNFLDGVNIDIEGSIYKKDTRHRQALNMLVKELCTALRANFSNPQISIDFGLSPRSSYRSYDYGYLSKLVDIVFLMAYDVNCCGPIAGPNSPANTDAAGLKLYMEHVVESKKLVLGLPWYGYRYKCLRFNKTSNTCHVKKVPFGRANCSDASGSTLTYAEILRLMKTQKVAERWDSVSQSPYITYKTDSYYQVWYDDVRSLKIKYDFEKRFNLMGVGVWQIDMLDYSSSAEGKKERAQMWGALPTRHRHSTQAFPPQISIDYGVSML